MHSRFQLLKVCSQEIHSVFKSKPTTQLRNNIPHHPNSHQVLPFLAQIRNFQPESNFSCDDFFACNCEFMPPVLSSDDYSTIDNEAHKVQNLLKDEGNKIVDEIEQSLNHCGLSLNEDLVLNILRRHRSDWKPAYTFFKWISRGGNGSGYSPRSSANNEILDVLGRMRRFEEVNQVLGEMSNRKIINEITYGIVLNRYAAAHKVEEATELFYKRREFGIELDLIAFQTLLMSLCRYKHVEAAEFLFHSKQKEFRFNPDIKTINIILNGWCVLGSLREAKHFWNDIIASNCKPDRFTYGIFINSLTKAGKLNTAVKLFQTMWDKGCKHYTKNADL